MNIEAGVKEYGYKGTGAKRGEICVCVQTEEGLIGFNCGAGGSDLEVAEKNREKYVSVYRQKRV